MVTIDDIKEKAQRLRSGGGESNLGPDRGTRDQLEARKERARQEARQEALAEQREQEIQQAREQGRAAVSGEQQSAGKQILDLFSSAAEAVDDGDDEFVDDFSTAMQTDFDNDGDPFGDELGFQTNAREQAENQSFAALNSRADENRTDINSLESAFDGNDAGGDFDFPSLEEMGFDSDNNGGF